MKYAACVVTVMALLAGVAAAQEMISAKPGLVNYTEGQVLLDGKAVQITGTTTRMPHMKKDSQLATQDGRAEVLLNPGVFLRLGENSAVSLLSDGLTNSRIGFLSGSVVVECAAMEKGETVDIVYEGTSISLLKDGIYRLDSQPAQLKVYEGEAQVERNGQTLTVKRARLVPLNGVSVSEKFDAKAGDSLYRWARQRSQYLAMANISAARHIQQSGGMFTTGSWIFNPFFGMYTFVPARGFYSSPFGWGFWSPYQVWQVYAPPTQSYSPGAGGMGGYNASYGYNTAGPTYSGSSATVASSAPTASSAPASSGGGGSVVSSGGGAGGGGRQR